MSRSDGTQVISIWRRLDSIEHDNPNLNEETWRLIQPCRTYRFFGREVFITQPSSSFWVYFLGIQISTLGCLFLIDHMQQTSRVLWGIALVLWGVGALIAGTSYQAFGFQLKCKGRDRAIWTSWCEIVYLLLQQYSVSVMMVAIAFSCLSRVGQYWCISVALLVSAAYTFTVLYGAFKPTKTLITFELMVNVCTPFIFFMIIVNSWRYYFYGTSIDLALLGVWFGLVVTMMAYNWYLKAGYTEKLWQRGKWFSENDVLHVVLIVWVFYLATVVEPQIFDAI